MRRVRPPSYRSPQLLHRGFILLCRRTRSEYLHFKRPLASFNASQPAQDFAPLRGMTESSPLTRASTLASFRPQAFTASRRFTPRLGATGLFHPATTSRILPFRGFSLHAAVLSLINFMTSAIVIFAVHLFFKNTYLGRAIRAAADNEMCTRLMGVNTKKIYAYAMGISLMTAAVAGVLVGMSFTFYPHSGPQFLIISFGVIIIGGLGSMKGCFAGGLILALAQMLGAHFAGIGYQLLFGYAVLLVVLGIKPKGLFGKV